MGGWGWGWRRPRYVGGGGCLGALMTPFVVIIFLIFFLVSMFQNGLDITTNNGYDEEKLHDYADDQYAMYFSDCADYEDHILLLVLTTEDHYDYYYIAWKGDHIAQQIQDVMGNNNTELGRVMNNSINETNYKYSLDSDLALVMNTMAEKIENLGLSKHFTCDTHQTATKAKLVNNTDLPLTASTVETALENFVQATDINLVLVVEDAADVFGSTTEHVSSDEIKTSTITVVLVIVAVIAVIVIATRKKKSETKTDRYGNFDDQL